MRSPFPGSKKPQLLFRIMMVMAVAAIWGEKADARAYRPDDSGAFVQTGEASWYGRDFHGRRTASGERFDMNDLTAAHRTLPFGTLVRVTNLENGKQVIVRINDRGPHVRGRIIDLSYAAACVIGLNRSGLAEVKIEVLDEAYWEEERLRKEYEGYDRDSLAKVIQKNSKPPYVEEGLASFNPFKWWRRTNKTSGPEAETDLTAAHHSLPPGTRVKITNLENGKTVIVKINDRCNKVRDRIIKLSRAAAEEIEMVPQLVAHVKIEVVD